MSSGNPGHSSCDLLLIDAVFMVILRWVSRKPPKSTAYQKSAAVIQVILGFLLWIRSGFDVNSSSGRRFTAVSIIDHVLISAIIQSMAYKHGPGSRLAAQ